MSTAIEKFSTYLDSADDSTMGFDADGGEGPTQPASAEHVQLLQEAMQEDPTKCAAINAEHVSKRARRHTPGDPGIGFGR